jgi:hypothetical protein
MERSADLKKITQTEKANSNMAENIIIIVKVIRSDPTDKLSIISK